MMKGDDAAALERRSAAPARAWRLAGFAGLYVSFAATLGFLAGAAPIVLRERGAGLAAVGLLQLVTLPLGLTFLWAPALDRLRLPGLPHRLGWIALAAGCGAVLLLALAAGEGRSAGLLFALALGVAVAFATLDASAEALVVETVAATDRPAVTTAKLCGSSLGGLIGTGILVVVFDRLGWRGCFVGLAALDALCLAPMLFYPEARSRLPGEGSRLPRRPDLRRPGPRRAFRPSPALLGRALLLGLYFGTASAVSSGYGLLLGDLGLPLAALGFVAGTLGPAINLAATLAAGVLMGAVRAERLVAVLAVGVAASGLLLALAAQLPSVRLATGGVVLGMVSASALGVPVFNALYRWAQGGSAATSYSLLFGLGFLAAMPARAGGPALAALVGWPAFFALTTPAYVGALALVARAMRRTRQEDGAA